MRQVAVTGLQKAFGTHPVLTGVDLEVPAGSLTAILGPSGSGKTTLLRLMAGFDRADAGTIKIGDVLVDGPGVHARPERRRIGYVPQEGSLFPHLTVAANVGFGLPARERRGGKVASMLEAVGLGGFGQRYPHQLSGGQQQRVAVARALVTAPALILADEPTGNLDTRASHDLMDVFDRLNVAGRTIVLITHEADVAAHAKRVIGVQDGQIVADRRLTAPDALPPLLGQPAVRP
jgi:iron(III) transport system ATP-binding protein